MTLQDTFYLVAIITMSLVTFLIVMMVILLFYIKVRVSKLLDILEKNFKAAKEIVTHPIESAGLAVGTAVAEVTKLVTEKPKRAKRYSAKNS